MKFTPIKTVTTKMNLPVKLNHIMVLTGEPSGDLHAGHLVREIKQINNHIYFSGIGGTHLEDQKVDLFYNISKLSAMGLTEVFMQFPQIKKAFDLFKKKLRVNTPNLIILVDYPGFNLKAAQFAKDHYDIKILYYITPKVWAWKKSRLKNIKKYIDHAALILPFEEKIYKKAKIQYTYVGNPLMDEYSENIPEVLLDSKPLSSKQKNTTMIGLLPGSRNNELKSLLDIMIEAATLIHRNNKKVVFIISKASSINRKIIEAGLKKIRNDSMFQIKEGPVKDIFFKSELVIAASGTVTLEAALCCVPTIIVYKISPVSYQMAKLFVKVKYVGLANLIVNAEVMPELLQNDVTPEKISKKALYMLDNLFYFQNQLQIVRKLLGKKGASKRAANIAVNMLATSKLPY
ncbi:MAG: lipid-A-disaccharide synthase [Desulfobacula sp.]|jgi:lipid-A-disaccharide synthase|uniref:lipid-A-disaccharide synthase n=1 Tax=Desulfobacula sp. TaxID=2593537 RepID=UPI001D9BE7CC|nr:lipid-A-disaccharide synthase [Desulfobacula sp.]MBT3484443.1 lipid-A-disaccharide synthase [Desulfobacula sp.]MBT3803358.1 lipid-A-disaccharide synthase [Desulfobacula sp.]MBT4023675.1 lipid-A-disaccharide synthase [Desulfobacula sp.]MBT4197917.1 lipid-A-disaccharide synthase [Desulfobacula sp.]